MTFLTMIRGRAAAASILAAAALLVTAAPAAAQQQGERDRLLKQAAVSRVKGDPDAPVLVYEIADFQCPYCSRFASEVYPQIDRDYVQTGKVRWVFVNLPLPSHPNAWAASEAALCAGAISNRFWPMHDRIFDRQREWAAAEDPAPLFRRYAEAAGVPVDSFRKCVETDRVAQILLQDVVFTSKVDVTGTPTFIVNQDQQVVGMKSYDEWRSILDRAIEEAE